MNPFKIGDRVYFKHHDFHGCEGVIVGFFGPDEKPSAVVDVKDPPHFPLGSTQAEYYNDVTHWSIDSLILIPNPLDVVFDFLEQHGETR